MFLSIRDVNKIIELEKNLANDRMKTLLLRSVSHELRTPLNSIIYFTNEILASAQQRTEEEIKRLKTILVSSKLMLSLINDLLDYSKILAGVFSVQKSHFNLKDMMENTIELFQLQAAKRGLQINLRIDHMLPKEIFSDPMRISQILLNLIGNSLKYTLKGKIEICCVSSSTSMLKCYVEDTGVGMDELYLKSLFKDFSSTHIPNMSQQGVGIGLCISNLLVKQLGGKDIKVKSSAGKGSRLYFKTSLSEITNASTISEV